MTPGPSTTLALVQSGRLLPLTITSRNTISTRGFWRRCCAPANIRATITRCRAPLKRWSSITTTLFDKNGWTTPKTKGELDAVATAMMAKGITPFSVGNGDWRAANEWHVTVILNHYAGLENIYKALKGEIPWTDPVSVRGDQRTEDWYQKGWFGKNYFSLTGDQQALLLAKGEAGMAPNGTFSFDNMVAAFKQTGQELGVAAIPSLREGVPYPLYAVGTGSTMSINKNSANPMPTAFLDYLYSDDFYDRISKDWPGDWNLPLTSINEAKLAKNVSPLFATTFANFAKAVGEGAYGYTTWTFWPPATEDYLIHGIEQVWLDQISTEDYLKKMEEIFTKELADARCPLSAALVAQKRARAGHPPRARPCGARFAKRLYRSDASPSMPFLIPALVINVAIILVPALFTIAMAFFEWDGLSTPTWVGLGKFRTIFADPVFFSALLNNIKWTLIFLIVPMAMGLVASSLLLFVRRGRHFAGGLFLPVIIATVVVARVWQGMIYNPESETFMAEAVRRLDLRSARKPADRPLRRRNGRPGTGGDFSPSSFSRRCVRSMRPRSSPRRWTALISSSLCTLSSSPPFNRRSR